MIPQRGRGGYSQKGREEVVSDNSNADIECFSPSPIPVLDSDSLMEEIDLPFNPDDPMPSGIEDDDHDSKRDIQILKELLDNYSLSLPDNKSYHFDIPLPYRPPTNPPDDGEFSSSDAEHNPFDHGFMKANSSHDFINKIPTAIRTSSFIRE
nr:hypothetical protein [Tanacetum cinerariifolium]